MWHWQPSIFYSDEKCEILTLPLNKQKGDLTVYSVLGCFIHLWQNYYVSEVCSLFMMGVWHGVTLIHLIFLLFVAICVLRGQTLRQSLGYKVFVRDQHPWREREERDFVERDNERLCRSDKDSCTQRGSLQPKFSIRCVLNGVRMVMLRTGAMWNSDRCLEKNPEGVQCIEEGLAPSHLTDTKYRELILLTGA